jgi:hypothetical protein
MGIDYIDYQREHRDDCHHSIRMYFPLRKCKTILETNPIDSATHFLRVWFSKQLRSLATQVSPALGMAAFMNDHIVGLSEDGSANSFRNDHRLCETIRVAIHTMGLLVNSELSANHVSVFLLIEDSDAEEEQSVRVDMNIQGGSTRGMLVWSKHNYHVSNSTIAFRDYPLEAAKSIGEIYDKIRDAGLHMYQCPGSGSGCRFWTYVADF